MYWIISVSYICKICIINKCMTSRIMPAITKNSIALYLQRLCYQCGTSIAILDIGFGTIGIFNPKNLLFGRGREYDDHEVFHFEALTKEEFPELLGL